MIESVDLVITRLGPSFDLWLDIQCELAKQGLWKKIQSDAREILAKKEFFDLWFDCGIILIRS